MFPRYDADDKTLRRVSILALARRAVVVRGVVADLEQHGCALAKRCPVSCFDRRGGCAQMKAGRRGRSGVLSEMMVA